MNNYKIIISWENENKWKNWGGNEEEIIEGIISKLREDKPVYQDKNTIKTDQILIDFVDENGILIADFILISCQIGALIDHCYTRNSRNQNKGISK